MGKGGVMSLAVVGAGLGRTGTSSLKVALERLLECPCYHMVETFDRPIHLDAWRRAALGEPVDWRAVLDGFGAAVDWPAAAFWRELASEHPGALVLLSTRESAATWWRSADATIFRGLRRPADRPKGPGVAWREMWDELARERFTTAIDDPDAAMAAYERHNASVRADVEPQRLIEWQPGDGWSPLCNALGVDVPDAPFPHENSTADFQRGGG
jgi:hypothetical protein